MIRSRLLPTLCAAALLGFTGCSGDDKNASGDNASATSSPSPAVNSPKPAADKLIGKLTELNSRIRTADAAFARVVGVTATDPGERINAFNKAVAEIGGDTATSLGADLRKAGVEIVAAWDSNTASISDGALRHIADANRDTASSSFAELDAALKKTDAALAFHAAYVSQVRAVLGSRPGADQLVAARPASKELTRRGNLAIGWLEYAVKTARKAGVAPVPVITPKIEEAKPAEAAPAETKAPEVTPAANAEEKPKADTREIIIEVRHEEPAPAPKPAEAPKAPEAPKPVEAPKAPEAPSPKPATSDPVPEPIDA